MQLFVISKPSFHKTVILAVAAVRTSHLKLTHYTLWQTQRNNRTHNSTPTPTQHTPDQHNGNIKKRCNSITEYIQYLHNIISIHQYINVHMYCRLYRSAGKSLARPDWKKKKLKGRHFFVWLWDHCCREDLVGRTTFWIFIFLSDLQTLEFGRWSLFPSWSG